MKALTSFPKGSAPGPCGLKPQHLKDVTPGFQEVFEIALGKVMHLMNKAIITPSLKVECWSQPCESLIHCVRAWRDAKI
eukprot:5191394-Amphidinium_carterae.1